jgi:TolB-like protein
MSPSLRVAFVLCLSSPLAALAEPPKDAVVTVSVDAVGEATPEMAATVTTEMEGALIKGGKLRVVNRAQIAKVMKEQAIAGSGMTSDDVQLKVGQLVSARWLLLGTVQVEEGALRVSAKALDSSTAQLLAAESYTVSSTQDLGKAGRQLARLLQDALVGGNSAQSAGEELLKASFDPVRVKEGARELARRLAAQFPKVQGKLREVLPNKTSSCVLSDPRAAFAGQRFSISAVNDITGQLQEKGAMVLSVVDDKGHCSGKIASDGAEEISDGDTITSVPLKIAMDPLEVGIGMDPALGKAFSAEVASSLKTQPAFEVSEEPKVTLSGRISGSTGHAAIEVRATTKGGSVLRRWDDLVGNFALPPPPPLKLGTAPRR